MNKKIIQFDFFTILDKPLHSLWIEENYIYHITFLMASRLDEDVYVVKNLNRFRHFECAIGWPKDQNIGSQVFPVWSHCLTGLVPLYIIEYGSKCYFASCSVGPTYLPSKQTISLLFKKLYRVLKYIANLFPFIRFLFPSLKPHVMTFSYFQPLLSFQTISDRAGEPANFFSGSGSDS